METLETLFKHKSVREYKNDEISDEVLDKILSAGTRASNTGNMQLYSVVVTKEKDLKEQLSPLHFNQAMVKEAPIHLTICADINRFNKWCNQRDAKPGYDNLLWFMNASTDAILASQNICIAAESFGLGVCYLGTIIYNAKEFINLLDLPHGVFPVAAIVIGYPKKETQEITDRLPLHGVIHYEKYKDYTPSDINAIFSEKENLSISKKIVEENKKQNLSQVFTDNRYKKSDNEFFSTKLREALIEQGFIE